MHVKDLFTKQCVLGTIGLCFIGFGGLFAIFWEDSFNMVLAKELVLGPNTKSYDVWKTPPIPFSMDIYFFNWTNPTNFSAEHFQKPILKEIGPYRFTEVMDKVDIDWHKKNSTVSFRKKSTYYFDEKGSKGKLTDEITTLNIVALSAAATAINWNYMNQKKVSLGLHMYNQEAFITKTANELLFEGYEDDMISMAKEMPYLMEEEVTVPFDRFGWFYMRNGTSNLTGHYNMYTGENDMNKIGQMNTWNWRPRTDYFAAECGMVNGSAGEFYPPNQQPNSSISFFSPDMCRSLKFDYTDEVKINGLKGYKFSGGRKTVDNGTEYPENKCYSHGQSAPSGVMNLTACRYGTPVFMSFPHYYAADDYYLSHIDGLKPEKEKHEFYLTLEPKTGIPLDVAARLQINMLIRPMPNIGLYHEAPTMFFPVLWFEQRVTITDEMSAELKMALSIVPIGYICCGIFIAIGCILLFWLPVTRLLCRFCGGSSSSSSSTTSSTTSTLGTKKHLHHHLQQPQKIVVVSMDKDENHHNITPEISPLLKKNHHHHPHDNQIDNDTYNKKSNGLVINEWRSPQPSQPPPSAGVHLVHDFCDNNVEGTPISNT